MTDLPQWAVERAREVGFKVMRVIIDGRDGLITAEEGVERLIDAIASALVEAAKPKWREDMGNVPDDRPFVVGGWVQHINGQCWWESHVVWLDDETGDIAAECECPFNLEDFERWAELPAAPEVE